MGSSRYAAYQSNSEEEREVLRQEHALIEHDAPPRELEPAVHAAQQVLALADEDIGLGLDAVAVDEKATLDLDLRRPGARRTGAEDLHVGDHVTDSRGRLLGPVDAGQDLAHAARQRVLALVEPADVHALARELALGLVVRHVAPHRHEVANVVGEQLEPLLVAPLVEQLGFSIEELLDLLSKEEPIDVAHFK